MKTLTCAQFSGGTCDFKATAATEKEMSDLMWEHAKQEHPEKYASAQEMMKNATEEQKAEATARFHEVWEAAPLDK